MLNWKYIYTKLWSIFNLLPKKYEEGSHYRIVTVKDQGQKVYGKFLKMREILQL